jgi:hypothetical protein
VCGGWMYVGEGGRVYVGMGVGGGGGGGGGG